MMRLLFLAACAAAAVSSAAAQPVPPKAPARYTGIERASRTQVRPPGMRMALRRAPEFTLAPLSRNDRERLGVPGPRLRAGVHRQLPSQATSSALWEVTPAGARVWRMSVRSPGATGIRLEFAGFSVGDGKVWLHDGAQVVGPYTGRGIFDDGHFWTATVFSESVTVEYEPADPSAGAAVPFEIRRISHEARRAAPYSGAKDPADYCHLDPNCYPEWQPAMSSVAQLVFEEDGLRYVCSGSLVATRDNSFTPYLLTAGHCINSEEAARSLEVYWTYQTSSCGGVPPAGRAASTKSAVGAHLIDWGTLDEGDYSLVLLKDVPAGVTFAGWDVGDPAMDGPLIGLHHPAGSWKRISFGRRIGDRTVAIGTERAPGQDYLSVIWEHGRTEQGSSGSPLFSSPGVIVGTLSYGPVSDYVTACQIEPNINGYGRFSNAYPHIKDFLENLPAAMVVPDQPSVAFALPGGAPPAAKSVRLTTASKSDVSYKVRANAPWIQLSAVSGTVSSSGPAPLTVTIDPSAFDQPGDYSSTVTILSGAAPPQFLTVTAKVTAAESNVVAAIEPGMVYQTGGQWAFTIRLAETGGAATRVTAVKMNGADYSSAIPDWFGTGRIEPRGTLSADLRGSGRFPAGTQYFEFWGVDDSGRGWYRVATVEFR